MSVLMAPVLHLPVLLEEVLQALRVTPGGRYIDATVGTGGHAEAILQRSAPDGQLLGIDADPNTLAQTRSHLPPTTLLVNANFSQLEIIATLHDFRPVDGILFDLGVSSLQLSEAGRGFSFQHDAPLDMRYDPRFRLTAADIANTYAEAHLADLLYKYGEEKHSRRIARAIVAHRPLYTTQELVQAIERAGVKRGRIHPATRTFLALRLAVNQELESLAAGLRQAVNLLRPEGRLVVISYHSLEDRIVKQFLRQEARGCLCPPGTPVCTCGHHPTLRLVTRKAVTPSYQEVATNPRSRSAHLRAAERL